MPFFRLAGDRDIPVLLELEAECFSQPWSKAQWINELGVTGAFTLLRSESESGEPDGYAALRVLFDEAELLRIGVRPKLRGAGLGREILERTLREVGARGAHICHLEVRRDNAPAIALYRRSGFRETGLRPAYYPDGTDALLFQRQLPG